MVEALLAGVHERGMRRIALYRASARQHLTKVPGDVRTRYRVEQGSLPGS